jgi:hypothetical protein
MKAIAAPLRKEEFTKDQWFEICRHEQPSLTRAEFNRKWPDFCRYLEHLQNTVEGFAVEIH